MLERLFKKRNERRDAVAKAREDFSTWMDIAKSNGWKAYEEALEKKIDNIRNKIENDYSLTGEHIKNLQIELKVYNDVKRIPIILKERAKGGL